MPAGDRRDEIALPQLLRHMLHAMSKVGGRRTGEFAHLLRLQGGCIGPVHTMRRPHSNAGAGCSSPAAGSFSSSTGWLRKLACGNGSIVSIRFGPG